MGEDLPLPVQRAHGRLSARCAAFSRAWMNPGPEFMVSPIIARRRAHPTGAEPLHYGTGGRDRSPAQLRPNLFQPPLGDTCDRELVREK